MSDLKDRALGAMFGLADPNLLRILNSGELLLQKRIYLIGVLYFLGNQSTNQIKI